MSELDVICFKWKPRDGYRSSFSAATVNVLRNMVRRHLRLPHRFSCITDDARGIEPDIRVIPLWDTYANVANPSSNINPSCYRRLRIFSEEARTLIGERIVSLDLDVVITADITPLFDRDEDFVIWGGQSQNPRYNTALYCWYNGSVMMLRAGTRTKVWTKFDPKRSPQAANAAGCRGSDQGWISYCLGNKEAVWSTADGVYSYRNHIHNNKNQLPDNARIVVFHGKHDPWSKESQRIAWIKEHYR